MSSPTPPTSMKPPVEYRVCRPVKLQYALTPVARGGRPGRRGAETAARDHALQLLCPGAVIEHRTDGSPVLVDAPQELYISVSHSRLCAVVALSPRPLGIDIEQWRDQLLRVEGKYLNDSEMLFIYTPLDRLTAWTAKEAIYKLAGQQSLDCRNNIILDQRLQGATVRGSDGAVRRVTLSYPIHTLQHTLAVAMWAGE